MKCYPYNEYRGRKSGTGGGCGCGCSGNASNPNPFLNAYVATNQTVYQPANQQVYQTTFQPTNQQAYQTTYQPANQQAYQTTFQPTNQQVYHAMNHPTYHPPNPIPMSSQPLAMAKPIDHPSPSPEVLRLLEGSPEGEKEDRIFYKQLIDLAPTTAEKEIIEGIRDDELSHYEQFRLIYRELTGNEMSMQSEQRQDEQPLLYMANLCKALFGEIAAVKKYRVIRAGLTSKQHRDMLFSIITDELTHMGKYNYLITLNKRN